MGPPLFPGNSYFLDSRSPLDKSSHLAITATDQVNSIVHKYAYFPANAKALAYVDHVSVPIICHCTESLPLLLGL